MVIEHNGCGGCAYQPLTPTELPCRECREMIRDYIPGGNLEEYEDMYTPKEPERSQPGKDDVGKTQLTLVPRGIIRAIAKIRMHGNKKYKDPDNWKDVDPDKFEEAAFRHWLSYLDDPDGVDDESGYPHLWHLACNIAFLIEMRCKDGKNPW